MASTTGMRGAGFYDAHSSGQRAAMEDILRFYQARAVEIKPGGKLLVQVFGRNDEHEFHFISLGALLTRV